MSMQARYKSLTWLHNVSGLITVTSHAQQSPLDPASFSPSHSSGSMSPYLLENGLYARVTDRTDTNRVNFQNGWHTDLRCKQITSCLLWLLGSPPAGFLYDSNMYSTPLSLLQLPPSALTDVTQKLNQPGNTCARITQDGKCLSDLKGRIPEPDFLQATEVEVDIGFVCKKCQMVYPAEVLCLNHQRASCFPTKAIGDIKAMLKLVQVHVECRACRERFVTVLDFKFHCDMDRHIKRVQKMQREAAQKAAMQLASQHLANQQMQPPSSVTIPTTSTVLSSASAVLAGLSGTSAPVMSSSTVVSTVQQPSSAVQQASNAHDPSRNGLQDLMFNSGVQQDFRSDLDATLRLNMGLDNVIRGQGLDSTSLDMFDPTSKSGMCNSGDSTLPTEPARL